MGDARQVVLELDEDTLLDNVRIVHHRSRGSRACTVPVSRQRNFSVARSREMLLAVELTEPLAGAVENRRSARQADGQKSLRSNQPRRRLLRLFPPECVLDMLLPYRQHFGETQHVSFGFPRSLALHF
tara:strand:- start:312 stop:695 length:384 start_codon:yes stop_codon:yes gene_type:complete